MANLENKLREGGNTKERKKDTKKNNFLMFNCLIKKLGCIWFSENTKKRKNA